MEINEASPFRREEIELEMNKVLDDIAKVLKEHSLSPVKLSIEVLVELTEEQASSIPNELPEKLKGVILRPNLMRAKKLAVEALLKILVLILVLLPTAIFSTSIDSSSPAAGITQTFTKLYNNSYSRSH